jgi:hypothetical protein
MNVTCPEDEGFMWHDEVPSPGVDMGMAAAASCDAVYQVGYTSGSLPGQANSGGRDAMIRKLGPDGQVIWGKLIGTSASDQATNVVLSSNECLPNGNPAPLYVVGYTSGAVQGQSQGNSDAFVVKMNPDGTEAWRRQFGTAAEEQAWSVAHAPDGSVYVVGYTKGNLAGVIPAPPSGTTSMFVRKYTASGNVAWTRQLGVNNKETTARAVSIGADGQIYIAGSTSGALAGQSYTGGAKDAFVVSYRSDGALGDVTLVGTTLDDQAFSLVTTVEAGNTRVYVAGITNGNFPGNASSNAYDAFLVKLDDHLKQQWIRQTTVSDNVAVGSLAVVDGSVVLAGSTFRNFDSDAALGSRDMFLRRYSSEGSVLRTEYIGTNALEMANDLAVDPSGNFYLTGYTDAPFCGHVFGGGGADGLLIKVENGCRVNTPDPICKPAHCWGDPHCVSFDKVAFSFQGEGEFVLANNADNPGFAVQVRQCRAYPGAAVSTARAVGARIKNDLVEYQVDGTFYVNGQQTAVPASGALALPGGGRVFRSVNGKTVLAWPTGERLMLRTSAWVHGPYIDAFFLVPPASFGKMGGILGNADSDATNEFIMTRDGSELKQSLTFTEMYQGANSFAEVWRASPAQGDDTLIQQGTSCGPVAAPERPMWLNDLTPAQRAAGEQACAAITDEAMKQMCILDVGLTGDAAFAASAAGALADLTNHGHTLPIINSPRTAYFNNFTGSVGDEWATISTDVTPLGDRTFLGQFGNETVNLTLNNLGAHSELTVSFDLYLINAWDGDGPWGPNVWSAAVDGVEQVSETFSNTSSFQSYPDDTSPSGSGAREVNTLAYPSGDSVYRMQFVVPHSASDVTLDLSASGLSGVFDEAWGVTNFEVQGR